MKASKTSAQATSQSKASQAKLRRDAAAFVATVTATARKIEAGQPLIMVTTIVDPRNNGLAALMLKSPPTPPPPLRAVTATVKAPKAPSAAPAPLARPPMMAKMLRAAPTPPPGV